MDRDCFVGFGGMQLDLVGCNVYKGWTTPEVVLIYLFVIADQKINKKMESCFLNVLLSKGRERKIKGITWLITNQFKYI